MAAFAFFNSRTGDMLVRATTEDLAIVEQAVELLNKIPPEVQIDAKFASVTQNDAKGRWLSDRFWETSR